MNQYPPRFFLSAQTPLGFVSRLSLLADPDRFPRVWLLKGGTRAKRSALIVRLAETAEESGKQVCRVLDPLAPMLLEAAFWDGFSVIDAAGPTRSSRVIPARWSGLSGSETVGMSRSLPRCAAI